MKKSRITSPEVRFRAHVDVAAEDKSDVACNPIPTNCTTAVPWNICMMVPAALTLWKSGCEMKTSFRPSMKARKSVWEMAWEARVGG
jgi:hypothetical protein